MDQMQRLMLSKAYARFSEAASILEVGCGKGAFLADIATTFPSATLTGVDISEKAIAFARQVTRARIPLQVASIEQAPFDDETFDLIFAHKTLHHWANKQQGLCEAARILKSGGLLLVGDAFAQGPLRHDWIRWTAEKIDGGRFARSNDMAHMLESAGLDLVEETVVPGSGRFLSVSVISK
jgi:ubiquinone/menaquinone biosynthesis C-methylase UbiE